MRGDNGGGRPQDREAQSTVTPRRVLCGLVISTQIVLGTEYSRGEPCTQVFSENRVIHIHITGVDRVYHQLGDRSCAKARWGLCQKVWFRTKILSPLEHTLFCSNIKICWDLHTFGETLGKKSVVFFIQTAWVAEWLDDWCGPINSCTK